MGLSRMLADRRPDGEGRVHRGVESLRVTLIALQRAEHMVVGVAALVEGVGDGLGEQRVRADLDEGAVGSACGGNRVAEPDRVAQIGHPVIGVELRGVTGVLDR